MKEVLGKPQITEGETRLLEVGFFASSTVQIMICFSSYAAIGKLALGLGSDTTD